MSDRMDDFDKRFKESKKEFDRDWKATRKWSPIVGLATLLIQAALVGFVIWVIVMVMKSYGII